MSNPNIIGSAAATSSFGYLGPCLTRMANDRRWALPQLDENSVVVNQAYPLQLLQQTPLELLNAVRINAQGSSVKAYEQITMPAGGADATVNLGNVRCFGVRVRITDSPLQFKFGAYILTLRDGTTPIGEVAFLANKVPAEIIMLGISNAGGQATAATIANPQIVITGETNGSATTDTTVVWAETLNLRDLGTVARA